MSYNTTTRVALVPTLAAITALFGAEEQQITQPQDVSVIPVQEKVLQPLVENLSLETLLNLKIESSSFFSVDAKKAPGTVWVISQEKISNSPARTIADILNWYAPATFISTQLRSGPVIAQRGIQVNNTKTLFLWNGQNVNSRMNYGYYNGLALPLLNDINRIEVITGPGALVHGAGAINGVINVIPKTGVTNPGTQLSVGYGTDRSKKVEVGHGWFGDDSHHVYAYMGVVQAEGIRPNAGKSREYYVQDEPSIGNKVVSPDQDHALAIEPSGRFSMNAKYGMLDIQAFIQRANIDGNALHFRDANAAVEYTRQDIFSVRPSMRIPLSDTVNLDVSVPIFMTDFELVRSLSPTAVANSALQPSSGGSEFSIAPKVVGLIDINDSNKLAIGVQSVRSVYRDKNRYFSQDCDSSSVVARGTQWDHSAFFEHMADITDSFRVSGGARYDKTIYGNFSPNAEQTLGNPQNYRPDSVSAFSPRLALAYEVTDQWTMKATYQRGFRTPDTYGFTFRIGTNSAFQNNGLSTLPELKPETMDSFELGSEWTSADDTMSLKINGYYNIVKNLLLGRSYTASDIGVQINQEQWNLLSGTATSGSGSAAGASGFQINNATRPLHSVGFEVVGNSKPTEWLTLDGSYGFSRPLRLSADDNKFVQVANYNNTKWSKYPEHMVKMDATVDYEGAGFNVSSMWNRGIQANDIFGKPPSQVLNRDRFLLNTKVFYKSEHGWNASFSVHNILKENTPAANHWSGSSANQQAFIGRTGTRNRLYFVDFGYQF